MPICRRKIYYTFESFKFTFQSKSALDRKNFISDLPPHYYPNPIVKTLTVTFRFMFCFEVFDKMNTTTKTDLEIVIMRVKVTRLPRESENCGEKKKYSTRMLCW